MEVLNLETKLQTKIILSLIICTLALQVVAEVYTYLCISSGRFIEGNPFSAKLFDATSLEVGLVINFFLALGLVLAPTSIYFLSKYVCKELEVESVELVTWIVCLFVSAFIIVGLYSTGLDAWHDVSMFYNIHS